MSETTSSVTLFVLVFRVLSVLVVVSRGLVFSEYGSDPESESSTMTSLEIAQCTSNVG